MGGDRDSQHPQPKCPQTWPESQGSCLGNGTIYRETTTPCITASAHQVTVKHSPQPAAALRAWVQTGTPQALSGRVRWRQHTLRSAPQTCLPSGTSAGTSGSC